MRSSLRNQLNALVKAGELKAPSKTQTDSPKKNSKMGKNKSFKESAILDAATQKPRKKRRNQKKKQAKTISNSGPNFSAATIRSAFGGPSPEKVKPSTGKNPTEPTKTVIRLGTNLERAWFANALIETPLIEPVERGIETSLDLRASDFEQIQLGFDFGTSSVKVVARLDSDNSLIPIAFRKGKDALVLPSRLFLDKGGYASLNPGGTNAESQEYLDLKIPLLAERVEKTALIRASLFIALVIRRVRAFVYDIYGKVLSSKQIFWLINFGVPASFQDERRLQARFQDVFDCAAYLATLPTERLKVSDAGSALLRRAWENQAYVATSMTLVQLVPEIAAQIYAIMRSEQWDSTTRLFTVIDVGAGTVDVGVVSVTGTAGETHLSFFHTEVVNHGAAMLNRYRLSRVKETASELSSDQLAYLDSVASNTAIDKKLPATWASYIPGSERVSGSFDPDYEFADGYMDDVLRSRERVLGDGNFTVADWRAHRVILCGGGRNEPLYLRALEEMTGVRGSNIGFDVRVPSRSREIESAGISQEAYERISVAYGLSFSFDLYPQLTLANQIPAFQGRQKPPSFDSRFVGKDSV